MIASVAALLQQMRGARMPRTYRTEFPDFDYEIPELPGFRDESWHNDICPKLVSDDGKLMIWVNYLDTKKREFEGAQQFVICNNGDSSISPILYQSNDWDSVLTALRLIQDTIVANKPTAPVGSHRIVELI